MPTPVLRHYSEAVKVHIVTEIEAGRLTVSEARRRFGIRGQQTIYTWLTKWGKTPRTATQIYIQMKDERDPLTQRAEEIRQLRADKQALESALAQSQLKVLFLESLITVSEQSVGMQAGTFKKNFGAQPLPTPEKR